MAARATTPGRHRDVFRFVRRRMRSAQAAEDVTQEVFADLARRLDAADPPDSLGWLYTVARRRIADELRRQSRHRTLPLDLAGEIADGATEYGPSVAETLQDGLASMPNGQREVVVGRLLQGRGFAELARDLDTSEEACRMRFMRGLRHLRDEFTKKGLTP
jgi:RNA polymerase sigma factor (sigma-70 family)